MPHGGVLKNLTAPCDVRVDESEEIEGGNIAVEGNGANDERGNQAGLKDAPRTIARSLPTLRPPGLRGVRLHVRRKE